MASSDENVRPYVPAVTFASGTDVPNRMTLNVRPGHQRVNSGLGPSNASGGGHDPGYRGNLNSGGSINGGGTIRRS